MKKILIVLVLLVIPICTFAEKALQPIRIGALLDLSAEYAMTCSAFREGIELATHEINQAGGLNGQPLEIIFEDTQYDMRNVHTASKKLINVDKVLAAVISTYTEVMVAGPVFETAKVPLINLWDSAPEIEALGDYIFGIGVWAPSSSSVAVDYVRNKLKAKTAVTISSNGEWSLGVAEAFRNQFKAAGGKVLSYYEVNPSDTDFRTILSKVKLLKPDVIYAPIADNVPAFWLQYGRSGINATAVTSDILNQEIIDSIGSLVEGVLQTQTSDPNYPSTQEMLKSYKEYFGKECTQVFFTSLGYDSIKLIANSIRNSSSKERPSAPTSDGIKKGLYAIKKFPGASGETTITPEGSSRKYVSIFQVKDQKLSLIN